MRYEDQDNNNDRKNCRRDSFKKKHTIKRNDDFSGEIRDRAKIKKALKSKIEKMKEDELWEEWEDEIS